MPKHSTNHRYTFIDLFAGIGGFHLALHRNHCTCVFASEWDKFARQTYEHNFRKISPQLFQSGNYQGDITQIQAKDIPDFDILCAGFPCQAFSIAGKQKGFSDVRGTMFFEIARIIKETRPKAFFLENVKHFLSHDKGKTFGRIKDILVNELGYSFHWKVIKACEFGLPQLRPRLYMVGFKNPAIRFEFPKPIPLKLTMSDIWGGPCTRDIGFTILASGRGKRPWQQRNWSAYYVDGEIKQLASGQARKMMGFPHWFRFPVSETQAMRQLGNSVAVNVVEAIAQQIVRSLDGVNQNLHQRTLSKTCREFPKV